MTDMLPVVSQLKSLIQFLCDDDTGARKTQENFLNQCPGVSQCKSLCQLVTGDAEGAIQTQKQFVKCVANIADGIPVVGHVKGLVHYACGDEEAGDNSMKRSSRTVGVAIGGVCGFVAGGPPGAVAGGLTGGQAMDVVTTAIDSAVHDEFRPNGVLVAGITQCVEKGDKTMAGDVVDMAVGVVMDGLTGYTAAKTATQFYKTNQKAIQDFVRPAEKHQWSSAFEEAQARQFRPIRVREVKPPKPPVPEPVLKAPSIFELDPLQLQELIDRSNRVVITETPKPFGQQAYFEAPRLDFETFQPRFERIEPRFNLQYKQMQRIASKTNRVQVNHNMFKPLVFERKIEIAFGPAGNVTGVSHEYGTFYDPNTEVKMKTEMSNQDSKYISKHPFKNIKIKTTRKDIIDTGQTFQRYELDPRRFRSLKDVEKVINESAKKFDKKPYNCGYRNCQTYGAALTAKLTGIALEKIPIKDQRMMNLQSPWKMLLPPLAM